MSNFKASKLSKIKIFPFVHLNPSESLSYQALRWWGRENVSKPPSPCSSVYLKWALKGRLTRIDDLFPEVHYLHADCCALCAWTGICVEGGTGVPLSLPLGTARFSPFWGSQRRPTATQERLRWEKDCDRSILPAFENKSSPASKKQSFVCPNFLFPNNAVVPTALSHPTHTNVHDADADLFYLDMKPLLHCQPKKPSLCWWTASHLTPPVPRCSLSP